MFNDDILKTRKEIKRFFIAGFWTLLLETLLCLYIAYISNFVVIFTFMLQNSLSLIVYFFAIIAMDLSIKDNSYKFPYGTGKLENFISFFQAAHLYSTKGPGVVIVEGVVVYQSFQKAIGNGELHIDALGGCAYLACIEAGRPGHRPCCHFNITVFANNESILASQFQRDFLEIFGTLAGDFSSRRDAARKSHHMRVGMGNQHSADFFAGDFGTIDNWVGSMPGMTRLRLLRPNSA